MISLARNLFTFKTLRSPIEASPARRQLYCRLVLGLRGLIPNLVWFFWSEQCDLPYRPGI